MSDLIERKAAINAIRKGYPDVINSDYKDGLRIGTDRAIYHVERLPSAQPGIIHCKDCIYYRWEIDMCDEPYSTAHNVVHEDDYCSKAERRTDCNGRD